MTHSHSPAERPAPRPRRRLSRLLMAGAAVAALAAVAAGDSLVATVSPALAEASSEAATPQTEPAVPVSVAVVEQRHVVSWQSYSGRLEAVDSVAVRPRVAGQVTGVLFREGGLVAAGDVLMRLDPAPYAAEVARAEAQVAAAEARLAFTGREHDRGRQLAASGTIPRSALESRAHEHQEARAALGVARAALTRARLDLGYTEVRAPVAGRVGRAEVTVGNLVSGGGEAPVLTTLVSVDPIYATFAATEETVMQALAGLRSESAAGLLPVERIPVRMTVSGSDVPVEGHVQMIDNVVDADSGTIRVRAQFPNPDGRLMPGQFARLALGQPETAPALLVSDRAIGTDQDKKFVLVVGADDRVGYRAVTLGERADGLRIVTAGLNAGERIVVNGLQRVRPGSLVATEQVAMAPPSAGPTPVQDLAQR